MYKRTLGVAPKMLDAANKALSAELIMAASIAPTKMAMATGCRYALASSGTINSELAMSGIMTLPIMPRKTATMPNIR